MTPQTKPSLWTRFTAIAQPYFFPAIPGAGWSTLLLLTMLMIFLFGLLMVCLAGIILAENQFAPALTAKIASGLTPLVTDLFHSNSGLLIAAALAVPAIVFAAFHRHLRTRRQAWLLLALVLLLSLCVTGINVAFSYIGNYFTNALVKKIRKWPTCRWLSISAVFWSVYPSWPSTVTSRVTWGCAGGNG